MKDCFHEKCNNEQPKNMLFFLQILKSLRYSYVDVAKKAGITPQLVAYWVDHDDIKLSRLIKTMEALGMEINCSFEPQELPQEQEVKEEGFEVEIQGIKDLKKELPGTGFVIENALAQNGNMKFLAELIKEMRITLVEFSELVGRKYQTMHHYFRVDDIKVSIINDIGRKLNRKVYWRVKPLKKEEI